MFFPDEEKSSGSQRKGVRAQAGEPCGARGVTKARDQAPFQATDLFQAPANYPYFTSNFKFHLIQFEFQGRSLKGKRAGGWGPGEGAARGYRPSLPAATAARGLPNPGASSRNASPLVPAAVIHVRPISAMEPNQEALEQGAEGRGSAGGTGSARGLAHRPFCPGSRHAHHYGRRSPAKSAFSTMTNLFLRGLSAPRGERFVLLQAFL